MLCVANRVVCAPREIEWLKNYIQSSSVPSLASMIGARPEVSRGTVGPPSDVGNLKTFWANLGVVKCKTAYGTDNFLVCQVLRVLQKPICDDKTTLRTIKKYIELKSLNELEIIITIVEKYGDLTIWDGNKRAVACFEHAFEKGDRNYAMPVYVVTLC